MSDMGDDFRAMQEHHTKHRAKFIDAVYEGCECGAVRHRHNPTPQTPDDWHVCDRCRIPTNDDEGQP